MRLRYPSSFPKLLLAGLLLVALPLILALINNAVSIDRLADQSQHAVQQAVQATQSTRELAEIVTREERLARQYLVLGDPQLLQGYALAHEQFLAVARELSGLPLDPAPRQQLRELMAREEALFGAVPAPGQPRPGGLEAEFAALAELARAMMAHSNEMIAREVTALRGLAQQAQAIVVWQVLALIPAVLFLVAGFAVLIARPIRQLETGIRRLGNAEFAAPISVDGPRDLESLGRQLDWLRRRLVELEEQKGRFLRHVSHELKTPLTALREGAELLADESAGPLSAEQKEVVRILRDHSIQLKRLIEDLLSYSAVQAQAAALDLKPVRMRRVIEKVASDQKLALRAKELRLALDCPDLALEGDEEKLRVVLDNLVSNAIKFSPPGGEVRVAVRRENAAAVLEVADQGPGVAPEERERVFEPFYQGRAAPSGPVAGTGVGLAIAREHVAAHRGRIEVLADGAPGARFRVTLPLAQEAA